MELVISTVIPGNLKRHRKLKTFKRFRNIRSSYSFSCDFHDVWSVVRYAGSCLHVLSSFADRFYSFVVVLGTLLCALFRCLTSMTQFILLFAGAMEGSANLKTDDYTKAMKFCKFATSALQYEDAKTAVENLTKALNLLTTGHE